MSGGPLGGVLRELLEEGRAEGCFPRGAAWVSRGGRCLGAAYVGGAGAQTLWDVASLTKPMAVGTLAMRGVGEGWLDLDAEVARASAADRSVTVRALLGHRSGLPAHMDFAARLDATVGAHTDGAWRAGGHAAREQVAAWLQEMWDEAPWDPPTVYSDLGYIMLGWHLERLRGAALDQLVAGYRPGLDPVGVERCAPTGWCPIRHRVLRGEVNDTNAWVLGGVAGHAGIFATVADVGAWATGLAQLAAGRAPDGAVAAGLAGVDGGVVRAFWDLGERGTDAGATWVLGWDTPSPGASSAGAGVGPNAVGHLGFTGTSVWIDRDADLVMVLLTNRVALGEPAQAFMRAFRPRFHDAVRSAAGA